MTKRQAFARLLTLFSVACAPMMSAPPAPPIPVDYGKEFGVGVNGGIGGYDWDFSYPDPAGSVQMWQRFQVGPHRNNEMGLLLSAGYPTLASGGAYYRFYGKKSRWEKKGHQIEVGSLWAGYSRPIAVPLNDHTWATFQPSIRFSMVSIVQLPVGVSIEFGKQGRLDAEVGLHMGGDDGGILFECCSPQMLYGGIAVSKHFGERHRRDLNRDADPSKAEVGSFPIAVQGDSPPPIECDVDGGAECREKATQTLKNERGDNTAMQSAYSIMKQACDAQEANGCALLSEMYLKGLGCTKDVEAAAVALDQACQLGHAASCR